MLTRFAALVGGMSKGQLSKAAERRALASSQLSWARRERARRVAGESGDRRLPKQRHVTQRGTVRGEGRGVPAGGGGRGNSSGGRGRGRGRGGR